MTLHGSMRRLAGGFRGCGRPLRRLLSRTRAATAAAMGPVLAAAGAALPSVPVVAAVAGAAATAAAVSVATAPAAKAVTNAPVLVLLQNGESTAPEATVLQAAGYSVTEATPAAWQGMTVAQFEGYAALVIGDPSSSGGSCSALTPSAGTTGSDAIGSIWWQAVSGNVAVLGTAPVLAGSSAATTLITDSAGYAAASWKSAQSGTASSGTGLYVSLNCEDSADAAGTQIPLLAGVENIGADGGLTVQGNLACTDPGSVNTWEAAKAGTFSGFASGSLATSSWGSGCPVDEAFGSWPAMFTPVAYDAASDATADFTASDGSTGQPYILLGAPVSSATAALAPTSGGEVLGGTTAGGTTNPAAPGVNQASAGDPVNTENGDFTQTNTDFSLPGFGPPLDFTRSYDALQAQSQTQTGTPGPMGYGWTDNWATSLAEAQPVPGDIYAAEGMRTDNGDGGSAGTSIVNAPYGVTADSAGDVYFSDTADNRVQEIAGPGTTSDWGIDMTPGDVYTVAGQVDGQFELPLDGGLADGTPALQAVLNHPEGLTVDASGDLFIADTDHCRVVEVQPGGSDGAGVMYTYAGTTGSCGYSGDGGSANAAQLQFPSSVHLGQGSQSGDLYVADAGNDAIREVAGATETEWSSVGQMQQGDIYTVAGNGNPGTGSLVPAVSPDLSDPQGVTVYGTNLIIADTGNCRIAEVPQASGTQFGVSMPVAGDLYDIAGRYASGSVDCALGNDGKTATQSDLNYPAAVRCPSGTLVIADSSNNRVQEVSPSGITSTVSGEVSGMLTAPQDLWVDGSGDIYIANTGQDYIDEVPGGVAGQLEGTAGGSPWTLENTGNGGAAVQAALNGPAAVASDSHGDVFIADAGNNRVQEVAAYSHTQFGIVMTGGDVYTVAGSQYGSSGYGGDGGSAGSALLTGPSGVATDPAGNLYIADAGNDIVREVSAATGDIATIAGTPGVSGAFSGNGTAATQAVLGKPAAVTIDKSGNVFIADSGNNEVLEVPAASGSQYGISGMTAGDIYVIAGASSTFTAPAAPTGLTVTGTTSSTASLKWTAPPGSVTGYYVYENGSTTALPSSQVSVSGTTATVSDLTASTTYTFTVAAYNSAGTSAQSTSVSATTAGSGGTVPGAPTGLTVTGTTSSTVSLSWTAPSGTVTGYHVYEVNGTTSTQVASVTTTTATVTGLSASTGYTFDVAAYNSAGTGSPSATVSATTAASGGAVPGAPTGVKVIVNNAFEVELQFTPPSGTISGYYVYEDGSSTPMPSADVRSDPGNILLISALTVGTTYTFTIAAWNSAGTGPQSSPPVQVTVGSSGAKPGTSTTTPALLAGGSGDPSGNSGDGGPATAALLNTPAGLAVDAAGNVYVSDTGNNQVREIAGTTHAQWGQAMTANDIYTIAGSTAGTAGASGQPNGDTGPATAATLSQPEQIALDTAGDLYITDSSDNRVREIAAANGSQWAQSMTVGDIYDVAGNQDDGTTADGNPAGTDEMLAPYGIGTDLTGDLFILQQGQGFVAPQLQEVTATSALSIAPPGGGVTSSLYPLTASNGGVTITQPGGSKITFLTQLSGGGCPSGYQTSGQGYCVQDAFTAATLTSTSSGWTYTPSPGADSYTYSTGGQLVRVTDTAGDILTVTYLSPAPGSGGCPSTATSCYTVTAASGRTLVVGSNGSGLVTSVTDPMGRSWTYAYNSADQLVSATDPMTNVTSYTYGPGSTGNTDLANALTAITSPNA